MDLLSGQKQKPFWSISQWEQVVFSPAPISLSFTVLQVLISGLIPPPCVYSGRLKSNRPSLLSPNLQHNPLGLKPLPRGEAREAGDGEGIGPGDWTRALFYLRGLESTTNQGSHQHISHHGRRRGPD